MKKKIVTMLLTVCMTVGTVNVPVQAQILDTSDAMELTGALDALEVSEAESPEILQAGDVAINETNFPDENFRDYISNEFDTDHNQVLSAAELSDVKSINVNSMDIKSLKGVEYFTNLLYLDCVSDKLTSLDVSGNTQLIWLNLSSNQLTGIDVSHNLDLNYLRADLNSLTSIDVSNNKELFFLDVNQNSITSIDVSNNPELTYLYVNQNALTSLDVTHNPQLQNLNVSGNSLTGLDVTKNPELEELQANRASLTGIDLTHNAKLTYLDVSYNSLKSLNLTNCPELSRLKASVNHLTEFDPTPLSKLEDLYIDNNDLTSLDVTKNPLLECLEVYYNPLTSLDVTKNPLLYSLDCHNANLTYLDVSRNKQLIYLLCSGNSKLANLDVYSNTCLKELECQLCNLKYLNIGRNQNLITAYKEGYNYAKPGYDDYNDDSCRTLAVDKRVELNLVDPIANFQDLDESAWYISAVAYAVDHGIMNGFSDTKFGASEPVTRAMFVTMLYNKEKKPATTYSAIFKDVPKDQWYSLPVIWAQRAGITNGIGNGQFGTNNNITREQLATMLYSYAQYKKMGLKIDLNAKVMEPFADKDKVSNWAYQGMQWAISCGVVNGKGTADGNILDPQGSATRAEAAQMMKNFMEKLESK